MIDSLKKTMLAGIGAAMVTKDKVESVLNDFVAQGKVSAADAKEMAAKVADDGREKFDEVSDQLSSKLKELLARLNKDTCEQVAALEARVAALEKAQSKPASKKIS